MNVPFISSGALSRAHYALVRKVESANSPQLADQCLLAEVQSTKHRLAHRTLSLKQCKECLIILLYCATTVTSGFPNGNLDFALPHAVNLAEAGESVQDKRIGYLFCANIMHPEHELQLMLVNTLRKDLESSAIPRICLALDTLIMSSTEDVIPAVQSRLHDLLSHNSYHVRRRTLLAFRALARHDIVILARIVDKVQKRLRDPQSAVVSAALILSTDMVESARNVMGNAVNNTLRSTWSNGTEKTQQWLLLKILRCLRAVGLLEENVPVILDILRFASSSHAHALLYESFLMLSDVPLETLSAVQKRISPVHTICNLLTSGDANEQYLFLSCLECMDPRLWAGTIPDIPAVLAGWEVERVMMFLDSSDNLIRKKTLSILNRIDANIVGSYYFQRCQAMPSSMPIKEKNEYTSRLLEVLATQCGGDGELYGRQLIDLLRRVEKVSSGEVQPVLEEVVKMVIVFIQNGSTTFQIGCVITLVASVAELASSQLGPTAMVIISALASEYCDRLSIPPVDVLRGLANRLSSYAPSIQDACLLAMLRIVAACDEAPQDVTGIVTNVAQLAGRHIRHRCDQFITLSGQKNVLAEVVSRAQSPSLPGFLEALNTPKSRSLQPSPHNSPKRVLSPSSQNSSSSRASLAASKLRYAAYEPPKPAARLRRSLNSHRSSSSHSITLSDPGYELPRVNSRLSTRSEDTSSLYELSRTVTAGDLALAVGRTELETISLPPPKPEELLLGNAAMSDLTSRVDLIAFDSPFITDPPDPHTSLGPDFESTWNALEGSDARGWCEMSTDVIVRRLQALQYRLIVIAIDRPPFEGDLKLLIARESATPSAALRLRESEDESCLWRLRCEDPELRTNIKHRLTEG